MAAFKLIWLDSYEKMYRLVNMTIPGRNSHR